MSSMKSVHLALELATRRRDDAGHTVVHIRRMCLAAEDQMGQLESYAIDTQSKWALASQIRASPEIMRHYDQFMARLLQAVALQNQVVLERQQEFEAAKRRLLEAEIRIASLNLMLKKKQSGMHKLQAGREQKQLDEFAAMQHRRLHANIGTMGAS